MSPVAGTGAGGGRRASAHSAWSQLKRDVAHRAPRSLKQSAANRAKIRNLRYRKHKVG